MTTMTLRESKFYTLNQQHPILRPLYPEAATIMQQMALEQELYEKFPREAEIGDSTRVIINYVNAQKRSIVLPFKIMETLDSEFPLDDMLSKYTHENLDLIGSEDPIHLIFTATMATLTTAVSVILDKHDPMPAGAKAFVMKAMGMILIAALDNPLDIFINVHANTKPGDANKFTIDTIWPYKKRPVTIVGSDIPTVTDTPDTDGPDEEYANSVT